MHTYRWCRERTCRQLFANFTSSSSVASVSDCRGSGRDYLGRLSRLSIAIYTYVRESSDRILSPEQILRLFELSTSRRRASRDVISGHVTGTGSNDVGDNDDVTLREDTSWHAHTVAVLSLYSGPICAIGDSCNIQTLLLLLPLILLLLQGSAFQLVMGLLLIS